jgi:hypothetical protein
LNGPWFGIFRPYLALVNSACCHRRKKRKIVLVNAHLGENIEISSSLVSQCFDDLAGLADASTYTGAAAASDHQRAKNYQAIFAEEVCHQLRKGIAKMGFRLPTILDQRLDIGRVFCRRQSSDNCSTVSRSFRQDFT